MKWSGKQSQIGDRRPGTGCKVLKLPQRQRDGKVDVRVCAVTIKYLQQIASQVRYGNLIY
jgi:hypothetical protein